MDQGVIIAGFGGQGILFAGQILAYAGMIEENYVSWLPAYGPEKRGGTANCHVIISDKDIASPVLTKATTLIAMNLPSLKKFENIVKKGGNIIVDSTIVNITDKMKDINYFEIPATQIATGIGNTALANIVLLGKYLKKTTVVSKNSFVEALGKILPEKKKYLIPIEIKALELGFDYI